MATIFIVEDERILRVTLADDLRESGHTVFEFADATSALSRLSKHDVDIIISDIKLPGMDGIELLSKVIALKPDIYFIMMTAYATVETAVNAIKMGAYEFLTKPFDNKQVVIMARRIVELKSIKIDNKLLRKQLNKNYEFSTFIGDPAETKVLFDNVKLVCDKNTTVLITGETGTGKERLTNIIHHNCARSKRPLIKVSCAVLSREIFESELFGHEKGAFTGADSLRKGRFELANNGTLYLDDIDDVPLDLQVKLLRVLEESEIERVGGMETIKIDVRIIASTKYDLKKLVKEGRFREDLFFRLNVFPLHLPPLRERKNSIELLVRHFIDQFGEGRKLKVEDSLLETLRNYSWPGNIRELKNLVERLVILAPNDTLLNVHVPKEIFSQTLESETSEPGEKTIDEYLNSIESNYIKKVLERCGNNKSKAAKILGLPLSTLRTRMEKYKIPF